MKSKKNKKNESKALSISHPNSRKALRLSKQVLKEAARLKSKTGHAIKRNIVGEKLMWFQKKLDPSVKVYTPDKFKELILLYLSRFDEELEQISIKQSISKGRINQHASRESAIRMTQEMELGEFKGAGIEMVDIMNPKILDEFRAWSGNLGKLDLFNIRRFSENYLNNYKSPHTNPNNVSSSKQDGKENVKSEEMITDDV